MCEKRYEVFDGEDRIASCMRIDDALMFIKAYFEKYYNEMMELKIKEMPRCEVNPDGNI